MAVYGEEAEAGYHARLSVLLSKLRRVVGAEPLIGRAQIDLRLPSDGFVDVEATLEAPHRAESHVAKGEWAAAWGPASLAYDVASRPVLRGHDQEWLEDWRRRLARLTSVPGSSDVYRSAWPCGRAASPRTSANDARLSGLECVAAASLELGGPELPRAANCARRLVEIAPFGETGHRILMEALWRSGNAAVVYTAAVAVVLAAANGATADTPTRQIVICQCAVARPVVAP